MFRLGRDLGYWDIDTLAEAMGSRMLNEWIAFYRYEAELQEELRLQADVDQRTRRR